HARHEGIDKIPRPAIVAQHAVAAGAADIQAAVRSESQAGRSIQPATATRHEGPLIHAGLSVIPNDAARAEAADVKVPTRAEGEPHRQLQPPAVGGDEGAHEGARLAVE